LGRGVSSKNHSMKKVKCPLLSLPPFGFASAVLDSNHGSGGEGKIARLVPSVALAIRGEFGILAS
ncbi:MAG TPA: hypothetical protein VFR10_15115, partial [bacterium]|nr:hypothetical protein [bacterium]